ncbi:kinesin-like protein KIN-14B [Prosopis cineraria]|uniref:kinesin-like protein KIN-14B n=1 Tax=Prosopis cineraria TaxID=364024 RepID=UPI0024104086|nr:kinesin-like protein KIN-14B [Prosopis cineraria]
MRSDAAFLTLDCGGSPIQNPFAAAAEDTQLASLISLDGLLKEIKSIPEVDDSIQDLSHADKPSTDLGSGSETVVAQWKVLQFGTGTSSPFIIKCGANSNSELVIKADSRVQEPRGGEIVRVAPRPSVLENLSLEEMKQVFAELPEALSLLALARTADGTRARYSRLYRTLAMKVPSLKDLLESLKRGVY